MGFWDWVGLIFFAIVGWNLIQWAMRISNEANTEAEKKANRKTIEDATNEMEQLRLNIIQDLNESWNKSLNEYINALQSGDSFIATAKGRDFYACNRRFGANNYQSQVIADEISIKNEVAKGRAEIVNALRLEELNAQELRDRFLIS